jgi:hypothetical protein
LTYLGFITEGKLAAIFITPSLGVPNWPVIYIINTEPPLLNAYVPLGHLDLAVSYIDMFVLPQVLLLASLV